MKTLTKVAVLLCGVTMMIAVGAWDVQSLRAEEQASAAVPHPDGEDADADARPSVEDSLDESERGPQPASDCSQMYWENDSSYHSCGTCPNGRIVHHIHRQCWGGGAWCPKDCGPWTDYYDACVPCG